MKIVTVVGTRPELIRLSRIIPILDEVCDHAFIHTGQNWDPRLNGVFFEELRLRSPDLVLDVGRTSSDFSLQVGAIMSGCGEAFAQIKPDKLLVLGDTNSALSAFVAKRMGIQVFHMEAGNRCYDDRVPEEVNRRVIDACSDVLLPYTKRSARNLFEEGYPGKKVLVTGNPIFEILLFFSGQIGASGILDSLSLSKRDYILATIHRQENVDDPQRLTSIVEALDLVRREINKPLIVSTHPRTRLRLEALGYEGHEEGPKWIEPLGLFDFVKLENEALCVLTDSGTVQEECCVLGTPAVTLRDTTERPETIECGSNVLSGVVPSMVLGSVKAALDLNQSWAWPEGYERTDVSQRVIKILLGYTGNS